MKQKLTEVEVLYSEILKKKKKKTMNNNKTKQTASLTENIIIRVLLLYCLRIKKPVSEWVNVDVDVDMAGMYYWKEKMERGVEGESKRA